MNNKPTPKHHFIISAILGTSKLSACIFLALILAAPVSVKAQTNLDDLENVIKMQEPIFSLPNLDDTLTVGVINLQALRAAVVNFTFAIPTYSTGNFAYPNYDYNPSDDRRKVIYAPNKGGVIAFANKLHLNLRFEVINWNNSPGSTLTIIVGNTVKTVKQGTSEVLFLDVKDANPYLGISVNGAEVDRAYATHRPIVYGLIPLKIDIKNVGIGEIVVPVIPASIVYCPVVDAQKLNQASVANSSTVGNTTTMLFTNVNSTSEPVTFPFISTLNMKDFLNTTSTLLSFSKDPYSQGISKGLSLIGQGLGTSVTTMTNSNTVTKQNSLLISLSKSVNLIAYAKQGGPGIGDVITYYRNARVFWYVENSKMVLSLIGADTIVQVSAAQLKAAYDRVKSQPTGTRDSLLQLDLKSINSLMDLDPFIKGGSSANLDSQRFKPLPNGLLTIGAGGQVQNYSYQVTRTDIKTTATSSTFAEVDNAGFLNDIGLGVSDTKTIQAQLVQSNSTQNVNGETFTQQFTFNGNGNEYYTTEVYFDVVFGSFAFRDLTNLDRPLRVSGIVINSKNKMVPNATVMLKTSHKTFVTKANAAGLFEFRLPELSQGSAKLSTGTAVLQINYKGKPIEKLKLKTGK